MIAASSSVIALAMIIGILSLATPYTNHMSVPNVNSEYIVADIEAVFFVLIVFIA